MINYKFYLTQTLMSVVEEIKEEVEITKQTNFSIMVKEQIIAIREKTR